MFRGQSEITPVVSLLEARSASLWHACQLRDLKSYLALGGIPSRSLLEQARVEFTPFATDSSDRSKGLWTKVFANLGDFGSSFARGWAAVPNPYGPIVMQIRPASLLRAVDVAITVRSAGAWDFDRQAESLETVEDLDRVFLHEISSDIFDRMETRFGETLREVFAPRYPNATAAEISVTIEPELIPLEDIIAFWVDPIRVGDSTLLSAVESAAHAKGSSLRVRSRRILEERQGVLQELVEVLGLGAIPQLRLIAGRADISADTRAWAHTILDHDLAWQFERYARYLAEGTLAELVGTAVDRAPIAAEAVAPYGLDVE